MEKAYYYTDIEHLRNSDLDCDRIYFGTEFCDKLIPAKQDLREAVELARDRNLLFSFVTCYITEFRIKKYLSLIKLLSELYPGSEVIINDWGLLRQCNRYNLSPVLGRLLVKQKRDPRISHFIGEMSASSVRPLRASRLNAYTIEFLIKNNIKRIEMDNLLQGLDIDELDDLQDFGISVSLYLPYGYVSTTRFCATGSTGKTPEEKFTIGKCRRSCLNTAPVKLTSPENNIELILRGNTIFFKNSSKKYIKAEGQPDRVVVEKGIPR